MKKILIVEDELGIVQFLKEGLEEEGFYVQFAHDGTTGLQMATNEKFDLLLLDWMMPAITGLELCKKYREIDTSTPILFLTAKDTIQEAIEGLKSGANDYVKKPFSFEELLERIRVHFRLDTAVQTLRLGPILLDVNQYKVTVSGKDVSLTQREFELLKYLILNKGKVCTRTQIIEDVWDIHFEYDTGVIDVFMNALRKKLNLKVEEDFIKTIRGVGYMANELS